ncbi:TPR-like protein [Xylona heveae TC161]|uniref:TPR-like protein n=1 Tax=Xylona heveae (strain CBS 132557 / TC161) TaxID=1328760 RepID=A0A165A4Z3_XYLHT|nr:TPR-like protein [Xylona heveae TC161]KZF19957.1 TPR-like protein [Xylona heveae TC161]
MSTHPQPSPTGGMHPHHGPPGAPQPNGHIPLQPQQKPASQHLASINEAVWLQIGSLTEFMGDLDGAMNAYEQAMRHNQWSVPAMNAISCILRTKELFPKAVEYLQNILKIEGNNGEVWGSLGHCYLMMDDLQQAYSAYQQALYHLRDPKEPKLWYGIGILYDRYGSLEHAEEAFSQVMRMQPDFEKANEIYFRLGIIYKQQQKFAQSLECFKYIVTDPPRPLTEEDIWFQIGHVHEQQKDYDSAKAAYRRVLERDPHHAKVLQQLGWLHHQQSSSFASQEQAIEYLEKSVSADNTDAQSWYLLGRCYMSQQKYPKAYEAYQQAVYRDGRNPTFWCSIGVLYYQINQYRDALDAYSRAIRLNPYISEVWYDLGTLYESCNNQTNDALDAYQRAADLDPTNVHIKARLQLLRNGQSSGVPGQTAAPLPQDVHPQLYQAAGVAGPPAPQWGPQGPASAPAGPATAPLGSGADWSRRLAEIQNPQPQQPTHFDQRDSIRPPPQPRQSSPRSEAIRQYQEQHRHTPVRRGLSPSPKLTHSAPNPYAGAQSLPQPPPSQMPQPPQNRITNPNYGATATSIAQAANGTNGLGVPGPLPPYGRGHSPPPEVRPIVDTRAPSSPGSAYTHQQYPHPSIQSQSGGIASGAPPPAAALVAAEAAAREREDRAPSVAPKRLREWEDEAASVKKHANEENRARLDDHRHHRASPPDRMSSPRERHRRSSSAARRMEDQRQANDNYHPSEAAHHPPSLPSMHHAPQIAQAVEPPRDDRREQVESAARKMDVDEDYDEDAEEESKRAIIASSQPIMEKSSPQRVSSNTVMGNGQSKVDMQT